MQHAFCKLCTVVLIKAKSPISCITSPPFFPLNLSARSLPDCKRRGRSVWSYGQSQKSKPAPFPGMAANTVCSEEIHPRTLRVTLGASVHRLRFWQLKVGSSKILLNMETHTVLAERQRANTVSEAGFREEAEPVHTVRSQSCFIQLWKLAEATQRLPATFLLSEKTSYISTTSINTVIQYMAAGRGQFYRNILADLENFCQKKFFSPPKQWRHPSSVKMTTLYKSLQNLIP